MKWTEIHSGLPFDMEMPAGSIVLNVYKGGYAWQWQVVEREDGEPDDVLASGKAYDGVEKAQARCLAVANGILLQRVREAWDGEAFAYFKGDEWVVLCSARFRESQAETMARHDGPFGWFLGDSETEALVNALENKP